MAILALVSDLVFEAKIRATAQQLNVGVRTARTPEEALAAVADAAALIVDLNVERGDPVELVRQVRAARPGMPIVCFFPHVQTGLKRAAQAAGADDVLPRSIFTESLSAILRRL